MMLKRTINSSYHGIRPRVIITDWDETITVEDTIKIVSETAYTAKPDFKPEFKHFIDVYNQAYNTYNVSFLMKNGERDNLDKERKFHEGMRKVEMTSIDEITRKGLFEGLTKLQFEEKSKNIKIRPYFFDFLRACERLKIPVIILSVNWTSIIIKKVLSDNGFKLGKNLSIIVNEFEFEKSKTTGKWLQNPTIRTGIDKVNIVKDIKKKFDNVLFIGDSSTDLLSLIEADYGVVMEGGSVLSSLKRLNIHCKSINDNTRNEKDIFSGSWKDLLNFIEN